jgi:putative ABC transport system permease protein
MSAMSTSVVARKRAGLALLLCLLFCLPVGASIAFLSALERVAGSAVPYPGAEDVFRLRQTHPEIPGGEGDFSGAQVELLRKALRSPAAVAGYRVVTATFRSAGLAESIRLAIASPEYLTLVTGERPPAPALRVHGAYVARRLWNRRFGKIGPGEAPAFFVDDRPYAVLGLLPAVPLYPMDADLLVFDDAFPEDKYDASSFSVVTLLQRDPARLQGWRAELAGHAAELATLAGITGSRLDGYRIAARPLQEDLAGKAFSLLAPLQLCALGLLLLGAFNSWSVWSWHLARERAGLVTRLALGAEPAKLLRRHLALAAATTAIAVAAGVWLAGALLPPLRDVLAPLTARHAEVGLSVPVAGVVAGSVLALGVATAALAWATARLSPALALGGARGRTGTRSRGWQPLVLAVQGTLCCGLILFGVAAWNQLRERRAHDLGFAPDGVEIAGVSLPEPPYDSQEAVLKLVDAVRDANGLVRENLAVATAAPLAGEFIHAWMMRAEAPDDPGRVVETVISSRLVSANYFSIIGARFRRGEGFPDRVPRDLTLVPVVVNAALVEHYWPRDPDPLGRRLFARGKTFRIVGIVDDIRETRMDGEVEPMVYLPYAMRPASELFFLWRSGGGPGATDPRTLFQAVRSREPAAVVFARSSLRARYRSLLFLELALSSLFGVMALFALSMYGMSVVAQLMQRAQTQAHSLAVRLALGSPRGALFRRFVAASVAAVALGVLGGSLLYRFLASRGSELRLPVVPWWQIAVCGVALMLVAVAAGAVALRRLGLGDLRPYLEADR